MPLHFYKRIWLLFRALLTEGVPEVELTASFGKGHLKQATSALTLAYAVNTKPCNLMEDVQSTLHKEAPDKT